MKKVNLRSFSHFFVAFTILFLILTTIILQVLTTGMYNSTDDNMKELSKNPALLAGLVMQGTDENISNGNGNDAPKNKQLRGNFGSNISVVLYDKNGNILNPSSQDIIDTIIYNNVHLDTKNINDIKTIEIDNPYYGKNMQFRSYTMKVNFSAEPNVAYLQILENTDQLAESLSRSRFVIITTMIIFWILSVFISIYLSMISFRPMLEAYEKQKTFVENASHELRTPLAILQNRLELLFQKPTSTIIEESENISESLNEVRNMRILTSNLLNLAKGDEAIEVKPTKISAKYFETIFDNYALLAENNGKKFTSSIQFDKDIYLDESLIKQVLTILFDNAVKYTGDDGEIDIKVREKNHDLTISIADNGLGLSNADKGKIFDRFYRVDKARTRATGGFGLGLSLAKQIIDTLGGKIDITDNTPKGSIFTVRLKI